jgi:hypothetical protein
MGVTRVLLTTSTLIAVALAPVVPASAADQITWPQVQAAVRAAQRSLEQGGGTVSVEVSAKISYRTVTDYQPGGSVQRERYREAGMAASEPAVVTWTVTGTGADRRYQPMPRIPKPGAYPTLRKASWVRLNPPSTTDVTPPLLRVNVVEPMGEIASSTPDAEGIIAASWTHAVEGTPAVAVTATLAQRPTGALVLQSFSTTDLTSSASGSALDVQVDFANPRLVVPSFRSALPEDYVDAAMDAALNTTMARLAVRNAADSARDMAATMTRAQLVTYLRDQVAASEEFAHPPANPSTDVIARIPGGLRLTNLNAYSGQSTIWTITVTQDKQVDVIRRTQPSRVIEAPRTD